MIQPLAYIHPQAKIANSVVIDPFAVIHKDVVIGEGTWIGSNVTIMDGARIGKNCRIFPGAVISAIPQDLKYNGEETTAVIGDNTTIREYVTINRGTADKWETKVETKLSYLDSIKKTFVNDEMASCVDSLWMKELTNVDLYNNLNDDIKNINIDEKVDYELPTELLKERLAEMVTVSEHGAIVAQA